MNIITKMRIRRKLRDYVRMSIVEIYRQNFNSPDLTFDFDAEANKYILEYMVKFCFDNWENTANNPIPINDILKMALNSFSKKNFNS